MDRYLLKEEYSQVLVSKQPQRLIDIKRGCYKKKEAFKIFNETYDRLIIKLQRAHPPSGVDRHTQENLKQLIRQLINYQKGEKRK